MKHKHQRTAMSYILVLGTVMALTVIGLSAITSSRIRWRTTKNSADAMQSRLLAQSAIDLGLLSIENDPTWRNNNPNGTWVNQIAIRNGFYSIVGVDPNDGDLSDDEMASVIMTGIGIQNRARYKLQVTLQAQPVPISALASSIHAGYDINIVNATVNCDSMISTNNRIDANNAIVNANIQAVTNISGSTYNGTKMVGITPKIMPRTGEFDYYINNGTPIAYGDLTTGSTSKVIENVVLSPANNPYGSQITNPDGIYIIDCGGAEIKITDSRIVGTLLLINPGLNSAVENSVNWEPAIANLPALLVNGSMNLIYNNTVLNETGAMTNVNYNPIGTPYNGVDDTDTIDTYPSIINGLIYASADLTLYNDVTVTGLLMAGNTINIADPASGTANVSVTYDRIYFDTPPPGFTDTPKMQIADGSWRQVVD